ncbi:hypothetical protein K432DRAFT_143632 [Lepidopterella palustris CBS 459.81]|uniref:Uncharacterized protein n=1 Tax=Lepidopterella palustris CBS 459.81 TaxID=1314670 RepID=A0A8E2EME0_9PEZI|nr:hypothetical protein K432DRAFT_143632 [Lepidopterella palustris CBS 459.81]
MPPYEKSQQLTQASPRVNTQTAIWQVEPWPNATIVNLPHYLYSASPAGFKPSHAINRGFFSAALTTHSLQGPGGVQCGGFHPDHVHNFHRRPWRLSTLSHLLTRCAGHEQRLTHFGRLEFIVSLHRGTHWPLRSFCPPSIPSRVLLGRLDPEDKFYGTYEILNARIH